MLDTSDEFEFEFEKVICTHLLLRDHKISSTGRETKKQFEQFMVFEPAKFLCNSYYIVNCLEFVIMNLDTSIN